MPGLALHSTIPKLLISAAMVGGAGSLLAAGSAQATIVPGNLCWFGIERGPLGTPECTTYDPGTTLGTQFTIQDKLVNLGNLNWGPQAGTLGFQWTPISPPGFAQDQFSLQLDFNPDKEGPYAGQFDYKISVLDPKFQFATAELDSIVSGVDIGTTVTKKILGFADIVSTDGSNVPGVPVNGKVLTVQNLWDVKAGSVLNSFGDTYTQAAVPGPLPLLGAGIAFGFSRKLRRRINSSAQA